MCSPVQLLSSALNRKQPINLLLFRIVIFLVPRNQVIWTARLNATKIIFRHMRKEENQLDVTECFIALMIRSTCFGHLYVEVPETC